MNPKLLKKLKKKYNNGELWHESHRVTKVNKKTGTITLMAAEPTYEVSEETMLIWNLLNEIEYLQNRKNK